MKFSIRPFPYLVIDDFLSSDECEKLITEANPAIHRYRKKSSVNTNTMGGRTILPCTNDTLKDLINKSKEWKILHERLTSINMIDLLLEKVVNSPIEEDIKVWIKSKNIYIDQLPSINKFLSNKFQSKWKRSLNSSVSDMSSLGLIFTACLNMSDHIYRLVISLADHLLRRRRLSLLYDYSLSKKGYTREVHRDSDSRVIVFLLYLNSLEEDVGGKLCLYKSINEKTIYDPIPKISSVEKFEQITPSSGKLIMFLNTSNAYHAASLMTNSQTERHFIYGGFTLSSDLFSLANIRSNGSAPTAYSVYRQK